MNFFYHIVNLLHFNRNNWKSIVLCFIAAIIFWLFNALDKDYTTSLRFPIQFDFDKVKYVPVEPLPDDVLMQIKGNGWDILRKSLNFYSADLIITLENPTEREKIVGTSLPLLLADQLKSFEVNQVITDTLHLKIDPWETRKIEAKIDLKKFTFAVGFGRWKPIVITPNSVEVTGPKRTVEALHDSVLINIEGYDLNSDFKERAKVGSPNQERLKYTPATVDVAIDVVEWGQTTHTIRLDIRNVPEDIHLDIVKDSVNCVLKIPKDEITSLKELKKQPTARLDLKQVGTDSKKIQPQVIGLPAYAQLLQIDSIAIKSY